MPTNAPRASATIHRFPPGGRAGLAVRRQGQGGDRADNVGTLPTVSQHGSWYHDEAIREAAEKPRKN